MIVQLDSIPGKRITQKMIMLTHACNKVMMNTNDYYKFTAAATAPGTKKDLGLVALEYNRDYTTQTQGHYATLGKMQINLITAAVLAELPGFKLADGEIKLQA